jgi:predicted nucleic acid-binding protein
MTLILDSGGLSALAGNRARLAELRRRDLWPPHVPAVVLAEALTGDARRDFHENHVLRLSLVRDVTDEQARLAAAMRTRTRRAGTISAVDALVAAYASRQPGPVVLTSDPKDLAVLAQQSDVVIVVAAV